MRESSYGFQMCIGVVRRLEGAGGKSPKSHLTALNSLTTVFKLFPSTPYRQNVYVYFLQIFPLKYNYPY